MLNLKKKVGYYNMFDILDNVFVRLTWNLI